MSRKYEEFIRFIYLEYLKSPLESHRDLLDKSEERAQSLVSIIRKIREANNAPYEKSIMVFSETPNIVADVRSALEFHNAIVNPIIANIIEQYFNEIVGGMKIEYFPEIDFDIIQQSGSRDARLELSAMIYLLKYRKRRLLRNVDLSLADTLQESSQQLESIHQSLQKSDLRSPQIKKRGTFKGIGSIAQGILLGITDAALALGVWQPQLPVDNSVGVVTSLAAGIGFILNGVGELRGE